MKVLVNGSRGYIGTPLMFQLSKVCEAIGVDNCAREAWVNKCTGEMDDTFLCPKELDNYIHGDLTNKEFVYEILAIHKPDVVIHLASQPSMPYSQINGERAGYTQVNNLMMTVNLLWGIKELGLKTKFIITTTTGIPGQSMRVIPEEPVANHAGSWYHVSRGFDSTNCALASKQWGQEVLELRTSIVYGIQTIAMKENTSFRTRFDTDFYFGTALNRFVQQAIEGKPITIYGKGNQVKPFISLEDTVESLINAITYKQAKTHEIMNQVTEHISIKSLANMIVKNCKGKIKHIDNPRKENEGFSMKFNNKKFLKLLGKKITTMEETIPLMVKTFMEV